MPGAQRAPAVPGPRLPRVVQGLLFAYDPVWFLERCHARHGDVFRVRATILGDWVYVADPKLAREVFDADRGGAVAGAARAPFMEAVVGEDSLLTTDGERWERQRRLLGPAFHGGPVERLREQIAAIAREEIERWPVGTPFALRPRLEAITLEVIVRLVFGIADEARRARMRRLLPALIMAGQWVVAAERIHPRLATAARRLSRFDRLRRELDGMLTEEIDRRRAGGGAGEDGDVLDLLLCARDDEGAGLSDDELRDQLVTVLEAGHETTATALAWTLERLVRHPAALARLTAEADAAEAEEYAQAVVKEALRTRPVIGDVARILTRPLRLGGFDLPAGTGVAPAIAVIQRRADAWPDPRAFRPERFLEGRPRLDAWLPFGGGRRRCIGSHLALLEVRTVLAEIVRRLDLEPVRAAPEARRIRHITIAPARGARVVARPREAPAAARSKRDTGAAAATTVRPPAPVAQLDRAADF